jgi:tetratricopeptide (TPR) repeat protein
VIGEGAGSYPVRYYRERATDRNLADAHSLPLQVLDELGVVGLLLLGAVFVASALALARAWRTTSPDQRRWASGLAAGGAALVAESAVDWLWLIPGLMGLGIVMLATAVAVVSVPLGDVPPRPRRGWTLARALPLLAVVMIALIYLSDTYVRTARAEITAPAADRLAAARMAERLNPLDPAPRFLQAGALEEGGRVGDAKRELLGVLDIEPQSFVALGLLGDLETRAGHRAQAREWYRRALYLNPRDTGLQQLAR